MQSPGYQTRHLDVTLGKVEALGRPSRRFALAPSETNRPLPVTRLIGHCDDLRSYLGNNETALIDYGSRYRADQPVSTSRAEGRVDEIANAKMAKRHRMRWSPRGAHRVATVRAAVLDGRLTSKQLLAKAA